VERPLRCQIAETSTAGDPENTSMMHQRATIGATVIVVITLLATMTFPAEIVGTVSAVDEKGMATIETTDGKELHVQMTGVKAADKVNCHPKGGKISCHKLTPQRI
jgi:hypothetical protein